MEIDFQHKRMNESTEYLSVLLSDFSQEEASHHVLDLMRKKDLAILNLANDKDQVECLSDIVCQHIAELGLKEILDTIKRQPISDEHYFVGSVLVAIKDLHIVKKYLWKDTEFIPAMCCLLEFSLNNPSVNPLLRDIVACVIQGSLLGGTPQSYYQSIGDSNMVNLFTQIFKNQLCVLFPNSYEELMMSLMLVCQNNMNCISKCNEFGIASILEEFAKWDALDHDVKEKALVAGACIRHMTNQGDLPDHKKLVLSKFSSHINKKNRKCKRMETIVCSNVECGKVEPDSTNGRFKMCAQCRIAVYCSKDCQRAHWKSGHSKLCVPPNT